MATMAFKSDLEAPAQQRYRIQHPSLASVPRIAISGPLSRKFQSEQHPSTTTSSALHEQANAFPPTPPSNSNESVPQGLSRMPVNPNYSPMRDHKRSPKQSSPRNRKLPTPDVTPPASLSPPQRLPSTLSSSVAESFRTARESPWLSEDDVSSHDGFSSHWGISGLAQDLGLGFEEHVESRQQTPTAPAIEEIPNREWDTNLMRNVTLRPKRKHKIPTFTDQAYSHSAQQRRSASPKTPTFQDFNQKFPASMSLPQRLPAVSPNPSEKNSRRFSGVSSTSTIVEAIVITTPPPKPRKLRHVSKTSSLRDSLDAHDTSRRSSRRISSDSQYLPALQSHSKADSAGANIRSMNGAGPGNHSRVITDPLLRHRKDISHLRADSSLKTDTKHGVNGFVVPSIPANISQVPSGTIYHSRTSSSCSPQPTSPRSSTTFHNAHSRQSSRNSNHSTFPQHLQSYTTRGATYRALENALQPAFSPLPSSTADSLVTIIKRPSTASFGAGDGVQKPQSTERVDDHVLPRGLPSTPLEHHLAIPDIGRRPSDASANSVDRSELSTRMSMDRSTVRSEDQPRHLYPQLTPFSQISDMQESALEVSEATAVNIYPHNNHSLLLVQQNGKIPIAQIAQAEGPRLAIPDSAMYVRPEPPRVAIQPSTPPPVDEDDAIDSPLRNPRVAPPPPVINVHPATPLYDEADPMAQAGAEAFVQRPGILQRARRYSDNLIQPFITRSSSLRRRANSQPPRRRDIGRDSNLHPLWHPRDFWDNLSDSDSEWEAEDDDYDPLPAGGDTSEPPSQTLPRRLTQKLPGFRGAGGFLIGNSLNLERHGSNKRRHHVDPPTHLRESKVTLRRDSRDHERLAPPDIHPRLRNSQSLSSLRSADARRRIRRRWRIMGLQVHYIGLSGMRERWQHKRLARDERKAEIRRDQIRQSIGPKFLLENGPIMS